MSLTSHNDEPESSSSKRFITDTQGLQQQHVSMETDTQSQIEKMSLKFDKQFNSRFLTLDRKTLKRVLQTHRQSGSRISCLTDDDGSFWTARDTLRASVLSEEENDDEEDEMDPDRQRYTREAEDTDVALVWIPDDSTYQDQSYDLSIPDIAVKMEFARGDDQAVSESSSDSNDPTTRRTKEITQHIKSLRVNPPNYDRYLDETPMPSRVLYLFHPPTPPTQASLSEKLTAGSIGVFENVKDEAEAALWHLVIPPIEGLKGMSQVMIDSVHW